MKTSIHSFFGNDNAAYPERAIQGAIEQSNKFLDSLRKEFHAVEVDAITMTHFTHGEFFSSVITLAISTD
jgi:hypothetical protein